MERWKKKLNTIKKKMRFEENPDWDWQPIGLRLANAMLSGAAPPQ
jgi:hypothetical protein